ncbi:MAG: hypothetical protein WCE53_00355 [Candidatus Acidiferrum sp.]
MGRDAHADHLIDRVGGNQVTYGGVHSDGSGHVNGHPPVVTPVGLGHSTLG